MTYNPSGNRTIGTVNLFLKSKTKPITETKVR